MAARTGQYVRTTAGAIAQGGKGIAGAVLARGGSRVDAADALQEHFPRLPREVAYELARNVERQTSQGLPGFMAGQQTALPLAYFVPVRGLVPPARYLVRLTYTDPVTGEESHVHHWIEGPVTMTFAELVAEAGRKEAVILQRGFRYPEEEEAPDVPEEPPVPSLIVAQRRA